MPSNLDRFRNDLENLIRRGTQLLNAMQYECFPNEVEAQVKKQVGKEAANVLAKFPSFSTEYQAWYSESLVLIKQLLPDRRGDFTRHYEKPKVRKEISYENYRIEDYLQGLNLTRGYEKTKVVGPDAAIPHFQQQLAIVAAMRARLTSSLFDIRQLVMADLFDSELESAKALAKAKFLRAAGAVTGVVLEKHLKQVCGQREIRIAKKNPGISDLNNALKESGAVDVPQWRFIQHLADIRNLCDHDKNVEPTPDQINDLVEGVAKVTKTVF